MAPPPHPLRPLLHRAVLRDEPLGDELAELAWTMGTQTGDSALLAGLARRADLNEMLRVQLRDTGDAAVRTAYLQRPDLDPGERVKLISTEKRAKVLAVLAADPNCAPEVLTALARRNQVSLSLPVLANPSAPVEALRPATSNVIRGQRNLDRYQEQVVLRMLLTDLDGTDGYMAAVGKMDKTFEAALAGSSCLRAEHVDVFVARYVTGPLDDIRGDVLDRNRKGNVGARVAQWVRRIILAPAASAAALHECQSALVVIRPHILPFAQPEFAETVRLLDLRVAGDLGDLIHRAHHSDDPDVLDQVVVDAGHSVDILRTVMRNRAAGSATVARAFQRMTLECAQRRTIVPLILDVIAVRHDDHDVLLALWDEGCSAVRQRWTPRTDTEVRLALNMLASDSGSPYDRLSLIRRMQADGVFPDGAAGLLPVEMFAALAADHPACDLGVDVLHQALSATPVTPAMLIALAADFAGNLDDLLEVCVAIDGDGI